MTHAALLSDLVDLSAALETDSSADLDSRKRRDRGIGRDLQAQRLRPVRQLHGWLGRVDIPGWQRHGQAAVQLYHVLCVLLAVAGLAGGWGLARAVLYYNGDAPINILHVLGLLVIAQIALLLLWLLAAMPWRLPLFGGLRAALAVLHPGRLARLASGWFAPHGRQGLDIIWDSEHALVMAPVARWLLSFWSQLFSVWFNIGVLAAAFYLIAFSDLAFAWGSTLTLDNALIHRVLTALSWPWHSLFPDGVPSRELVDVSRYYRLDAGTPGGGQAPSAALAAQLGGWWTFLVAAIFCYGLLPRLLTLLISWLRLRHHLGLALPRLPGAPELLARMNSPLLCTAAARPERAHVVQSAVDDNTWPTPAGVSTPCAIVVWSDTPGSREQLAPGLLALGIEPRDWLAAGGVRSTQQDREMVAALCHSADEGVAVVARAWEPPLLEFVDFIQNLRAQCNRRQAILVLLWGGREKVEARERDAWRLTLAQLKDPDLHVEVLGPAA
jgi:Protein of unknown function (DUF2868)